MPAHALSWAKAYPALVVPCAFANGDGASKSDAPALDPTDERTYALVAAVDRPGGVTAPLTGARLLYAAGGDARLVFFAVPSDASDALARALRAAVKAVAFDEDDADALARAALSMLEPPEPAPELEAPAGAA